MARQFNPTVSEKLVPLYSPRLTGTPILKRIFLGSPRFSWRHLLPLLALLPAGYVAGFYLTPDNADLLLAPHARDRPGQRLVVQWPGKTCLTSDLEAGGVFAREIETLNVLRDVSHFSTKSPLLTSLTNQGLRQAQ